MKKTWSISAKSLLVKLQESGKVLGLLVLLAIIVMVFACFAIFALNVKGPEEVMVPEVRGKELAQALIEMQTKELYPKITLRYSDMPGDEGTILDQDPASGTIVKGYSRVSLVVSRGVVVDHIENYVGMNFDSLKMHLQTLFAGSVRPLIVLANPIYKADISEAGTILEQNPPAGTEISDPVTVKLVVSRGPNFDNTRVPHLVGLSLDEMISLASRSKLIFDFTSHV
ncbi:MAG: PASTA domain-containing protein, partial [Treponemataceae bacterium]|nr:PASTA domain-containing protein [Treponemataceae bacterium]